MNEATFLATFAFLCIISTHGIVSADDYTLTLDGKYVGGSDYTLTPNGEYVGNND
jgi:hypothetical protein